MRADGAAHARRPDPAYHRIPVQHSWAFPGMLRQEHAVEKLTTLKWDLPQRAVRFANAGAVARVNSRRSQKGFEQERCRDGPVSRFGTAAAAGWASAFAHPGNGSSVIRL